MSVEEHIHISNSAKVAGIKALINSHDRSIKFHIYFGVIMFILGVLLFLISSWGLPDSSKVIAQCGSSFVLVLCTVSVNTINKRRGKKGVLEYLIHYIKNDPIGFSKDEDAQRLLKQYLEQTLLAA